MWGPRFLGIYEGPINESCFPFRGQLKHQGAWELGSREVNIGACAGGGSFCTQWGWVSRDGYTIPCKHAVAKGIWDRFHHLRAALCGTHIIILENPSSPW